MHRRLSKPFLHSSIYPQGAAWMLSLILAAGLVPPRAANAGLVVSGGASGNYTAAVAGATSEDLPSSDLVPTAVLQSTNDPNMQSISQAGSSGLSEVFGLGENFSGSANSDGFATAEFGALHAFAHAEALVTPPAYSPPGPGPFGPNPYYAVAQASFGASFTDTITLGGSLAAGTPVQLLYTFQMDSILALAGIGLALVAAV